MPSEISSSSDTGKSGQSDQAHSKSFNPARKTSDLLDQKQAYKDIKEALKDDKNHREISSVADKTITYLNGKLENKPEDNRNKSKYTGLLAELQKIKAISNGEALKNEALIKGLENTKGTLKIRLDKLRTKIIHARYSPICEAIGTALREPDNASVIQQTVSRLEEHSDRIGNLDKRVRDKQYDDAAKKAIEALNAHKDSSETDKAETKINAIKALKGIKSSIDRTMHNLTIQSKINESGRSEDFKKIMSNLRDSEDHKERKKYEITINNKLKQWQNISRRYNSWEDKNREKGLFKKNPYYDRMNESKEKLKDDKMDLGFFTSRKLELQAKLQAKLKDIDERLAKHERFGEPYKRAKRGLKKFGSRGAKLFKASREYWKESPKFRRAVYTGVGISVGGLLMGPMGVGIGGVIGFASPEIRKTAIKFSKWARGAPRNR